MLLWIISRRVFRRRKPSNNMEVTRDWVLWGRGKVLFMRDVIVVATANSVVFPFPCIVVYVDLVCVCTLCVRRE